MATAQTQKFQCKIDTGERESATFICIPFDVEKVFGKARVPVKLTINDFTYRTTICVMGGKYCVPLRKSNREGAGVKAGDVVQVTEAPDSEPRTVEVPADLKKFLQTGKVWELFDGLSFSHKKEYVEWITGAKKEETRAARKQKMVQMLKSKKSGVRSQKGHHNRRDRVVGIVSRPAASGSLGGADSSVATHAHVSHSLRSAQEWVPE